MPGQLSTGKVKLFFNEGSDLVFIEGGDVWRLSSFCFVATKILENSKTESPSPNSVGKLDIVLHEVIRQRDQMPLPPGANNSHHVTHELEQERRIHNPFT